MKPCSMPNCPHRFVDPLADLAREEERKAFANAWDEAWAGPPPLLTGQDPVAAGFAARVSGGRKG